MSDIFSAIRARLHAKSHDYFVFAHGRWDTRKRHMFYGATDALLDTSQAARRYENAITSDAGTNLLACYGFLQALYVQQDATTTLSQALGLDWTPNKHERLKQIRDTRNRLTGHPALGGKHEKPQRLSSAIIPYNNITKQGFIGHIYYEDGFEAIEVNAVIFQKDNEELLAEQMLLVGKAMDQQERQFRTEQAAHSFLSLFEEGFDYLLQRLRCDLKDDSRLGQAQAHAKMIRERMDKLKKELTDRGFGREANSMQIIFSGIGLLEKIMSRDAPSNLDQDELDLIYDGVCKQISLFQANMRAIDAKLRSPIMERKTG